MDRFEKVKACLKELGYSSFSKDDFQDKLVIQKIIFLLRLKGIAFNYHYNLYVRGPYSPDLTKDIYHREDELRPIKAGIVLDTKEKGILKEFTETFQPKPAQLEVAATYAWCAYVDHQDPASATACVRRMKGFYPEAQIALGISRAKQFYFRPSHQELSSIKDEAEIWDTASDLNGRTEG